MASYSDDLKEELRQNFKLRRELGVEVAKAKASAVGGPEPASGNDDLEGLRRELRLRRELQNEVAKVKDAHPR